METHATQKDKDSVPDKTENNSEIVEYFMWWNVFIQAQPTKPAPTHTNRHKDTDRQTDRQTARLR